MRQADWTLTYRETQSWRREYGISGVPVPLVALSVEMRQISELLDDISSGHPYYLMVQGPQGSGKSTIISAAQAALADAGLQYTQVLPTGGYQDFMTALPKRSLDAVVLIDDADRLPRPTLRRLVELRTRCQSGMLLTAARVPIDTSILLSNEADSYILLPSVQDRPNDLLMIASLMWERLAGPDGDLASSCDESALQALLEGVYPRGAWSLEKVLGEVFHLLDNREAIVFGKVRERISYYDVAPSLMRLARETFVSSPVAPTSAVLVVEGDTDEIYMRHSAELARERNGWELLKGLDVLSAGPGRGGGGGEVVQRALELRHEGVAAVGLFDYDRPGRDAFDMARRQQLGRLLLPREFDPLLRDSESACVEIEDLLPVEILARYYLEHEEMYPEEKHWRLGRLRIVPKGEDKEALATWITQVASYDDMERMVYVLVMVRDMLKLPCPEETRNQTWTSELARRTSYEFGEI
jgi:hypothetical protein